MAIYSEKLKDPRWQRKRLEIFQRDDYSCQVCGDTENTLMVHHLFYENGKDPWDYDDSGLTTLCADCHQSEHDERSNFEKQLLDVLKHRGIFSSQIIDIASGFNNLIFVHVPFVQIEALSWAMGEEDIQRFIIEKYFEKLKKHNLGTING